MSLLGTAVAQWLRRCATNRQVNPSWCHWNFFIDIKSFRSHYGHGVDSPSNRNEYQEYFLGVRWPVREAVYLTTILCRCHEIWGTLTSWKPLGHSRPVTGLLYCLHVIITKLSTQLLSFLVRIAFQKSWI